MHGGGGHAVDDGTAEMQAGNESGAEAVDESRRAEARRAAGARTVSAQALLHQSQEQAQGGALEIGIALSGTGSPRVRLPVVAVVAALPR